MVNKKLIAQINKAVVKGIQRNVNRIFDLSQDTQACYIPTDTGNLKRSGVFIELKDGAKIQYRAPYSSDVEFGIEADRPIQGTQVLHIPMHTRKGYTRKDGKYVKPVSVKAHDVTLVNKRVIRIRPKHSKFEYDKPIFRIIDKQKARPGQFFLSRAVKEGLPGISKDIQFALKQAGLEAK